jgi:hypothetical protein
MLLDGEFNHSKNQLLWNRDVKKMGYTHAVGFHIARGIPDQHLKARTTIRTHIVFVATIAMERCLECWATLPESRLVEETNAHD